MIIVVLLYENNLDWSPHSVNNSWIEPRLHPLIRPAHTAFRFIFTSGEVIHISKIVLPLYIFVGTTLLVCEPVLWSATSQSEH